MATDKIFKESIESLQRIQEFDPESLSRLSELGTHLNFAEIVPAATALIGLYKRMPVSSLSDLTDGQLNIIKSNAQSDFNLLEQILNFTPTGDAHNNRMNLVNAIKGRRDQVFEQLWQFVAYGVARTTDTSLIEAQARAAIQSISDESTRLTGELKQAKSDADTALAAIRSVAAEQGVSQQAHYFKTEAEEQENLADTWLSRTYAFAAAVGLFAFASLFFHKIEWLRPVTQGDLIQYVSSKILIFAVLSFLLILAARNYATHKHNAVVNKHRQNALLTYRALVQAASERGTEDIVLAHAASCIFAPQETGFSGGKGDSGSKSVLELLTKGTSKSTVE